MVVGVRRPRRLTPKALGVLKALMRSPVAVVTRDELFAEVWPDTLPTNDVLTQAVTQLRKAFATDEEAGTTYIETIAKTGYRLLVPVSAVEDVRGLAAMEGVDADMPGAAEVLPAGRRRRANALTARCAGSGAVPAATSCSPSAWRCWSPCWSWLPCLSSVNSLPRRWTLPSKMAPA